MTSFRCSATQSQPRETSCANLSVFNPFRVRRSTEKLPALQAGPHARDAKPTKMLPSNEEGPLSMYHARRSCKRVWGGFSNVARDLKRKLTLEVNGHSFSRGGLEREFTGPGFPGRACFLGGLM